jgi:hypothetical protein
LEKNMTVEKSPRGWKSTLLSAEFDSREAAQHYEDREKRRTAPESAGQKVLDGLSKDQLRSVIQEVHAQAEADQSSGLDREQTQAWLDENPHIIREGSEAGARNSLAIRSWLAARGKKPPFSPIDLELASNELQEQGVLDIDRKKQRELEKQVQTVRVVSDVVNHVNDDPLGPQKPWRGFNM